MWPQMLFSILSLHFAGAVPAVQNDMQYLLAVPSVLQSDSLNTACAHLFHLNDSVDLKIFLEYGGQNVTILTERVRRKSFFKCIEFRVPYTSSDPLAFITIWLKGATINASERRVVAIEKRDGAVFMQTDKPIYKPGQTVFFRIVGISSNFLPFIETYQLITIQDPQSNRIFQWTNVTSKSGIIQLSFPLIAEPILGNYQITVQRQSGTKTSHSFSVEEYVLPKFDSTISAPKTVSVVNPNFPVKVCSMYTYGQPVEGKVELSVCRNLNFYGSCKWEPLCESVNLELGKDGCVSHVFSSKTFELNRSGYWMNLDVKAIVTEKGTGVQRESSAYISISRVLATVMFQNMEQNYKGGIPYCGEMKLIGIDDAPIANEVVQLFVNNKNTGNYSTGASGTAQFCFDTSDILSPSLSLRLIYKPNENCNSEGWLLPYYPEAHYSVQRFYSRTNSFVKIQQVYEELLCGSTRSIKIHYSLNMKERRSATFFYFLLAKTKIVQSGRKTVTLSLDPSAVSKGSFTFQLTVQPDMAPVLTLLIYTLHPEREVVADAARFQIEKCFKNKVSLKFSEKQGLPASNISLHIEAAANSYCALRAMDESVLLLKQEAELSADSVYGLFLYELFGYYFNGLNLEDDPKEPCIPPDNIFLNGLFYVPTQVDYGLDIYGLIRDTGVKFVTNSRMRQPVVCSSSREHHFRPPLAFRENDGLSTILSESAPPPAPPSDISADKKVIESVRKTFPETWIWDLIPINSTGHAQLQYIIPDTITEWKANAFCLERDAGFGISGTASLTAFQPFFVEMTIPYSIVNGEDFLLRATIFNYLNSCIEIIVSLNQTRDFQAKLISPVDDNGCLCGSERKTYIWSVAANKIGEISFSVTAEALKGSRVCGTGTSGGLEVGRKDTLIKTLLVEPEGIEKEATQSSLICIEGAKVSEPVILVLPEDLVDGSARAYFSCIGDLMGTAMQNLHQLLQMPFGCGEQNMALFAPNIYIMEYLIATEQLSLEIKSKATGYLITGYQTQLTFKHPDGSYSAFGSRDKEGNTWLTAFVYKILAKCSQHIFIDSNVQTQSLIWLSSKQKSDGCFQNVGKLFNNALKGGVQDELSLTAYITAALLESGFLASHPVVRNALYCLESGLELGNITVYDEALLAYAFGLAGNKPKRDFLLDKIIKSAKKEGGTLHWEREDKPSPELPSSFYPRASSAEIEIASYVILALLTEQTPTSKELTIAAQIVQWITKHQNPYGGFSSTQDTVVAIQALAQFSIHTFSNDSKNLVKIHSMKPFEKTFSVDHVNRLLLQRTSLPEVPGNYTVDVNGKGCVFVQTTLRYNRILPKKSSGFSLSVKTTNESCTQNFQTKFTIVIEARYTGKRNVSNMVIIDVKMLTGFVADRSSLQKLQNQEKVMKVESKENHVICYLDSLSDKEISLSFIVVQDIPVSNLKPATVNMYDYYEQDENGYHEYNFPCNISSF